MGERKLSPDRVRAEATIDYSVQVLTSYKETNGRLSKLSGFAGRSVSDIEIRNFAAASVEENAGEFTLTQQEFGTTPGSDLDKVNGAATALRAPPNQAPTTTSVARDVVTHPSLGNIEVGAVGAGTVNNPTPTTPTVAITNSLPKAVGNFGFVGGVGTDIFWANNQADTASDALLHLDPGRPVFSVLHQPSSQTVTDLLGSTFAEATTTGDANRKVEGTVHVEIPQISLLPTTFAPDGVVLITNFVANLTCKSTGTLSSSAVTGSWSGNVKYWADSNNLDGSNAGAYVSVTNGGSTTLLSGSTSTSPAATDALAPLKTSNPLVYDSPVPLSDIYLFQDDTSLIPKKGYLTSWTGAFTLPSSLVKDNARVEIPTAMRLATARTNLSNEETQLAVDIAKLSCQSADRRG
jgi:hypothetical protein